MAAEISASDVIRMRILLQGVTTHLKEFMEGGDRKPPPRRASMDEQSAYLEWLDERWQAISEAEEILQGTKAAADRMLGVT